MDGVASLTSDLTLVGAEEAHALLAAYGIPTPAQRVAATAAEAAAAAEELGFPVVLKAQGVVHKSDVGGVRLGLQDAAAVRAAAGEMTGAIAGLDGFLVQEMASSGVEIIVGGKRDPVFGGVVVVGFGGVWTELLGDVALRRAPVTEDEAHAMLGELRAGALLDGYRGAASRDRDALARIVAATSRLIAEHPEVEELDLNPVIAHETGALAVDARILRGAAPVTAPAGHPSVPLDADAAAAAIARLMRPRSVVVIGASRNASKQGGRLLSYLVKHGFEGQLYAVNPGADEIMGCPSFPTVGDLPEAPDLACVVVPAAAVADAVEQCGRRGIPTAIVCTAGFAETGEDGAGGQEAVLAAARRHGVRLVGPNTNGVASTASKLCASFSMSFEQDEMRAAPIALLTHSGALGSSLLGRLWERGVGFSHWISVGNEADLQLGEYLHWLAEQDDTRVIAVFMESVRDAGLLEAACRHAREHGKAVLVYKTGYSAAGRRAVQSHTSALAGDGAVYDAALDQLGAIRVPDLQTLLDAGIALAWQPAPRGPRVGVVSASGGACSVIADECARHGLEVPLLPKHLRARVAELIPPFASPQNPIDVTAEVMGTPGMIGNVLEVLHGHDDLDALVVMLTTNAEPGALDVAQGVTRVAATATKPIYVVRMGAESLAPNALALYREARVPVYPMPDMAIRALSAAVAFGTRHHDRQEDRR